MEKFNINEIKEIQRQSLSRVIRTQLEEMILTGKIQPGDRINESRLSSELGVSRAPIREACRQLERHGMVEVRANKGTFVNAIDIKEVIELYDIRAALDALAGERAARHIAEKDVSGLKDCLKRMKKAIAADDVQTYFNVNLEFHYDIIRISGNSNLYSIMESLYKKASLFRKTSLSLPGRLQVSYEQHKDICEAVEEKNPKKAFRLMHQHVMDAKAALVASLGSPGKEEEST